MLREGQAGIAQVEVGLRAGAREGGGRLEQDHHLE